MLRYILNRLLAGALTVVVLITIAFFLMHLMPGGPFSPDEQKNVPPEVLERVAEKYGLNRPLGEQYVEYWKNLLRGDLGISYKKLDTSVNDTIAYGFPVSMRVGLVAVVLSLVVGIPLGVLAAIRRGRLMDFSAMAFATIGISIPVFVISILLMYLFAGVLKWLPSHGLTSWRHYILPVSCLAFNPIAYIARQTRSSMLEALEQDYIRTARAKGLRNSTVILKHALKNAVMPVVTYLGPLVAGLLTGSFVVEKLFSVPGIGRYFVQSIADRDYTMILGITIFFGIFVIVCNLIVDIFYALIDPRVKIAE
jgi:oligopeptide transport system permease protein